MFIASGEELLFYIALYSVGLLPFYRVNDMHVLQLPWMTRDFVQHKYGERAQYPVMSGGYWERTFYITCLPLLNKVFSGFRMHLEKRGIFSCFWVVNCDDEATTVINQPGVYSIMSDRPSAIKSLLKL